MSPQEGPGGWAARACSPPTCDPLAPLPRLETLSMRLTVLLVRMLVHLGLMPSDEGLSEYLET